MPERDRTAVHVDAVVADTQLLHPHQGHRREGLVDLEQVDVGSVDPRTCHGPAARFDGARQHQVRIDPDIRVPQLSDPDYASRPKFRESDLRRHLINEKKVDNGLLEKDEKADPRFTATAADLKAKGIEDFQLHYALQTIARTSGPARMAAGGAPKSGTKR